MAEDVLSQAELETLLSALDSDALTGALTGASTGTPTAAADPVFAGRGKSVHAVVPRPKVQTHNFPPSDRLEPACLRTLETLHQGFARHFAAGLSAMLRSVVRVKLMAIDELAYGEFLFRVENPTCFHVLRADPLSGNLILDLQPSILYPMIDRMLGGGREPAVVAPRPLTDIELRLVSRIIGLLLQELRKAWHGVAELDLAVERIESNPQRAQVIPPQDSIVRLRFELAIHETRGLMSLCLPCQALQSVRGKLAGNDAGATSVPRAGVELVAYLAETRIAARDLLNLRVGDIITTEQAVQAPISVCLAGEPKFQAQLGAFEGRKAVEIVVNE